MPLEFLNGIKRSTNVDDCAEIQKYKTRLKLSREALRNSPAARKVTSKSNKLKFGRQTLKALLNTV